QPRVPGVAAPCRRHGTQPTGCAGVDRRTAAGPGSVAGPARHRVPLNPEERAPLPVRVVIAEDEAIIRLDLKEILQEEGYEVVGETGRGDEAVNLVREHKPVLVILDIRMPGVDGLAAAREITADGDTAVLILTAFSQRNLIEEARDAGALAYLIKPFTKTELVPAIEIALGRFQEVRAVRNEAASLAEQLETRKFIDRGKGVLMDKHGQGEAEAFAFIQHTAMSQRRTMKSVAEDIL